MAEDIHLPGGSEASKKWLIGGGAAAGLYVAWRWYQARQSAAAGPAALPVDTSNTPAGQGAVDYSNPNPDAGETTSTTDAVTTNAQWSARVESDLVNIGYDGQMVATALGMYLSNQPLSADQQALIRVAWAMDGKPPESSNLPIIPAQSPPTKPPPPPPPPPVKKPPAPPPPTKHPAPPPDPHAGMHWQPPQVATLVKGRTMRELAEGHYGAGYEPHLAILVQLNPNEGGPDHKATYTHLIRVSNARWVPN